MPAPVAPQRQRPLRFASPRPVAARQFACAWTDKEGFRGLISSCWIWNPFRSRDWVITGLESACGFHGGAKDLTESLARVRRFRGSDAVRCGPSTRCAARHTQRTRRGAPAPPRATFASRARPRSHFVADGRSAALELARARSRGNEGARGVPKGTSCSARSGALGACDRSSARARA